MTAAANANVVAIRSESAGGALALANDQTEWTPAQRAALAQLGLEKASDGDLAVLMHVAQRTGLDPFARQIYMIARWDQRTRTEKFTIQTGIDGFRIVADRRREYAGQVGPEWCGEDGVWRDVWLSSKPPAAARVGVLRTDFERPIYGVALFREYAGFTKDGGLTRMWSEKGALMIAKCAEALALRKAFPQDLSGIYTADEMTQADGHAPRMVIDQAAPQQAGPAAPAEPVWDEEIPAAERDLNRARLEELWHMAKHFRRGDAQLVERIAEAGKRVRVKVEKLRVQLEDAEREYATADPDGAVDAELVDSSPIEIVEALLDAPNLAAVNLAVDGDLGDLARVDVNGLGLLTEDDRERLALDDAPVTLGALADTVADYVTRHRHAVRAPLDADPV